MKLFQKFPVVNYFNVNTINITSRFKIVDDVLNKFTVFYPYVIDESDRPDTLSYDYYGVSTFDWLIMYTNNIIDPYYDWPLTRSQFITFLTKKYDSTVASLQSDIRHYVYTGIGGTEAQSEVDRKSWLKTPQTFDSESVEDQSGWTAVSTYTYEDDLNEAKRSINLLGKQFIPQITRELNKIFSDTRINISRRVV